MKSNLNKYLLNKRSKYILLKTSEEDIEENDFLDKLAEILKNGTDIIEIRFCGNNTKKKLQLGKKIRELTAIFGSLLIIYDRVDIAKLLKADGVLLDSKSMSIQEAYTLTEGAMLLGYQSDNEEELLEAIKAEADYLVHSASMKANILNAQIFTSEEKLL